MDRLGRARALAGASIGGEGVLGDVPAPALIALAERVRVIELGPGRRAGTRRDGSDFVLVVAAGTVALDGPGATCGAGELLGVRAALVGGAAIELAAVEAATLVEISVDDFLDVLVEHAAASAALARALAAQLRGGPR